MPTLPPVPGGLLLTHTRPAPPLSGSPRNLLEHAAAYGAYVGRLEAQTQGWRDWYQGAAGHE
ncbi:hypothetical protein L1281_002057 [Neisseria sp. HSC-16F19]|nr:hypothetical protein [Neisseria sp. HSC-16F19]MCP2041457.1 hypothetical protein [Neisseria sp. HSC-16F19]